MARSHLRHTVKDQRGNVLEGATVTLYETGTTTAVDDAYDALTGGSLVTSLTSDSKGEVQAWFDDARTIDLEMSSVLGTTKIAASGSLVTFTTFTESVSLNAADDAEGADGSVTIDGDLNHDGSNIGFFGTTPAPQSTGWTVFSNLSTDKTCDADATTVEELADILGTLIEQLKTHGLLST